MTPEGWGMFKGDFAANSQNLFTHVNEGTSNPIKRAQSGKKDTKALGLMLTKVQPWTNCCLYFPSPGQTVEYYNPDSKSLVACSTFITTSPLWSISFADNLKISKTIPSHIAYAMTFSTSLY
jgi:hypothetical protein